jgi:hypothetical protein
MDDGAPHPKKAKFADISELMKWAVVAYYNLGRDEVGGKVRNGWREATIEKFGISKSAINRLVKDWDGKVAAALVPDLAVKREGHCGATNLALTEEVADCIFEFSAELMGEFTYRSFARKFSEEYGIEPALSSSTIHRWFTEQLDVVQVSSYCKPKLTARHKKWRMQFVLEKTLAHTAAMRKFKCQRYHLHLDEKWFYVMRTKRKLKIFPGHTFLDQTVVHKSHIKKVMFIAVLGQPQYRDGSHFDGKVGLFPVMEWGVAQRNSANRPAGTPVVNCLSLTAEVYLDMMTRNGGILDTIKQKMPWAQDANIVIQHDGAPGHEGAGNRDALAAAGQQGGWNITFETQPAQSPDLNLCDLCFFNSLQASSFDLRSQSNTEAELIENVMAAWQQYPWTTLERAWGHLYACYREILKAEGDNQYDKPHSGVGQRQTAGLVVVDNFVPMDVYLSAMEAFAEMEHIVI